MKHLNNFFSLEIQNFLQGHKNIHSESLKYNPGNNTQVQTKRIPIDKSQMVHNKFNY